MQPADRGAAAADPGLLRSWEYLATGKVATANVLSELKCDHIKTGGCHGLACRVSLMCMQYFSAVQVFNAFSCAPDTLMQVVPRV